MTTNTVAFPTPETPTSAHIPSHRSSVDTRQSTLSISRHATALEICDLVYSASVPTWEAIERFYEPNSTYENPFVTATSRAVIADIHATAAQLAQIDVPKPVAVLYALLGLKREGRRMSSWFSLLRAWSEMGDVSESESFGMCMFPLYDATRICCNILTRTLL